MPVTIQLELMMKKITNNENKIWEVIEFFVVRVEYHREIYSYIFAASFMIAVYT